MREKREKEKEEMKTETCPKRVFFGKVQQNTPCVNADSDNVIQLNHSSFSAKLNNPPVKPKNLDRRTREYLTPEEVNKLIESASKNSRYGNRDAALILIGYRHGLRVSELINLKWSQIDFKQSLIHVNRLKNGTPSVHPIRSAEIRALKKLQKDSKSEYIFLSERESPLTDRSVRHIIMRAGKLAGLKNIHPHQLRHGTGFYLASKGNDTRAIQLYLGHKNIQHTVRYTELSPNRFKDFFQD